MYLPALPLQLLLQRLGCGADAPVAVLEGAQILWANRCAQQQGVRRGMRVQAARAVVPALAAEAMPAAEVDQGVEGLWHTLVNFTPGVEPAAGRPGLFWLDPNGLHNLYPSSQQWAQELHATLRAQGFHNTVGVGFNRYLTYAMACSRQGTCITPDARSERHAAERVWLSQLHVSAPLRDALGVLGVHTLGGLLALPLAELRQRFGQEAEGIHRMANDTLLTPLQAHQVAPPVILEQQIEPPDADHARLLFGIKGMLLKLLPQLRARSEALTVLHLRLQMTARHVHHERLQPAAPTLDEKALIELLRLRLGSVQLTAPVESLELRLESTGVRASQLALLEQKPKRDVRAANAALAKVRAALGEGAVTQARLCAAHLPEARFAWEGVRTVQLPQPPKPPLLAPLVRQVLATPQPLPARPKHQPEEWLGDSHGILRHLVGPFRVQSAWWADPVARDYYYARTDRSILWMYHHPGERRWLLQGWVD